MSKNPLDQALIGELLDRVKAVMQRDGCSALDAARIVRREVQNARAKAKAKSGPLAVLRARPFGHLVDDIAFCCWGLIITYRGTEAELIEHNRCPERALREMGSSGQKAVRDENGNRYYVRRRAKGIFTVDVWHEKDLEEPPRAYRLNLTPIWTQLGLEVLPAKLREGPPANERGAS